MRGMRIPIHGENGTVYKLQSGPIVRVRCAAADAEGHHAMQRMSGAAIFAAPPLTRVRLERIDPPGGWSVDRGEAGGGEARVWQWGLTVSITF